jgi:hypothetical protein
MRKSGQDASVLQGLWWKSQDNAGRNWHTRFQWDAIWRNRAFQHETTPDLYHFFPALSWDVQVYLAIKVAVALGA